MAEGKEKDGSDSDNEEFNDDSYNIYCAICHVGFNNILQYNHHVNGSKHTKAKKKAFMKEKYGAKYQATMKKVSSSNSLPSTPLPNEKDEGEDQKDDAEIYYCSVCKTACTGLIPYKNHLTGGPHSKRMQKQKLIEKLKTQNLLPNEEHKTEENRVQITDLNNVPVIEPFARCIPCNKSFSGPESYQTHMNSMVHKKTEQNKNLMSDLSQKGVDVTLKSIADDVELQIPQIHCKDCKKSFNSAIPYHQHVASKSHKTQQTKNKLMSRLTEKFPEILQISKNVEEISISDDSDSEDIRLLCNICHVTFSGPESAWDHLHSKKHEKAKKEKMRIKELKKQKTVNKHKTMKTETEKSNAELVSDSSVKSKSLSVSEKLKESKNPSNDTSAKPRHSQKQKPGTNDKNTDSIDNFVLI